MAEAFGENFDFPSPVIEGGGSGAGRKKLCEGVGETTVDIANSSSRISQSDIDLCAANGVGEISKSASAMTGSSLRLGRGRCRLCAGPRRCLQRPGRQTVQDGALVDNAAAQWAEVNPALPAQDILAFIPGTKHGTRSL